MSDDEEVMQAEDSGPSEAQKAMQKRRQVVPTSGLDEEATELLENNKVERSKMEDEIEELRQRSEQRKRERKEEEKLLTERRIEEDARRKAEEEERKQKKEADEKEKKAARALKLAEFEKWKNPPQRNFVITKKDKTGGEEEEEDDDGESEKKSKEQLEAEKRAILKQRIHPLEIANFDAAKLADKAKELNTQIYRLESERYDLERRFKAQQYDMMELAERARSMNKVGKQGSLKRVQLNEEDSDKMQERFAGCPLKILMYNPYDRQTDHRTFGYRRDLYTGPIHGFPAERIAPHRIIDWNEEGQPIYVGGETNPMGMEQPPSQEAAPVATQ